jgi:hypothetical protein
MLSSAEEDRYHRQHRGGSKGDQKTARGNMQEEIIGYGG